MIDVQTEQLIPLHAAAVHYPGSRPHRATVFRHAMKGVAGRRLDTVRIGGRRYTSREAICRFALHAGSDSDSASQPESGAATVARFTDVTSRLDRHGL